jgi:hypothetical protein
VSNTERFHGAWRLLSWELRGDDGTVKYPMGSDAIGQIVYTPSGRMSCEMMRPGAKLDDFSGLGSTEEAISKIVQIFFAYYGPYTVDDTSQSVTHYVEGGIHPAWIGTPRVRRFKFEDPDHLRLIGINDSKSSFPGTSELLWQRIREE